MTESEKDKQAAMDWYATDPPEVQACPTMFSGDAIAIYAAGLTQGRTQERDRVMDLAIEMAKELDENGKALAKYGERERIEGRCRQLAAGVYQDLAQCLFTDKRMERMDAALAKLQAEIDKADDLIAKYGGDQE